MPLQRLQHLTITTTTTTKNRLKYFIAVQNSLLKYIVLWQ